jgi:hypothetical protein
VTDLERNLLELRARISRSVTPSPELADRVFRRARVRRVLTALSGLVVAVAVGAASFALAGVLDAGTPGPAGPRPEEGSTSSSLNFEPALGWHVRTTDPGKVGDLEAQAWASNVPFPPGEEPIGGPTDYPANVPDKTEEALPPDGILLVANFVVQTRNPLPSVPNAPERTLPLAIEEEPHTSFEGQDPDRAQTVLDGIVEGRYLSVRVVFGTSEPGADLIGEAEEELGRLAVAPAPATTEAIDDFGIRMDLPEAWHGFLFSWGGSEPILQAGTKPVTDLYHASARRDLDTDDVLILLAENYTYLADYEPIALPVAIRTEDLCPTCEILDDGTSPHVDHALFYRSFSVDRRPFDLYVEFGTAEPGDDQLARVNEVLATLRIAPPDAPPPEMPLEVAPRAPISVDVPAGWVGKDDPVPSSRPPRVVAAYGTWDFDTGGDCGPERALQDLPADGALVWFVEHADPDNAGDYIELMPQFSIDLQTPPARWRCASEAPSRMYPFRVGGRYFDVHLALGLEATDATVREAEELIKSLRAPSPD